MRVPRFRRGRAPRRAAASDETVAQGGPPVVEEELAPPPPPPRPVIWPWLLALLILVAGGLIALWLFTRDNDNHGAATVRVPDVVNSKQAEAVGRLGQRGLVARIVTRPSSAPTGTVFAEKPVAGSRVTRGSVVTLSVSSTEEVTVPDVVGKQAADAVAALRRQGLSAQTSTAVSRKPPGTVLSQTPSVGAHIARGSVVDLRISRGKVKVPNVVGQSSSNAVAAIRGAGLVPKTVKVPSPRPKGIVVAQAPRAGSRVAPGSAVRLNVSRGAGAAGGPPPPAPPPPPSPQAPPAPPPTATVPSLSGLSQAAAQKRLNTSGFKARVVYVASDKTLETVVAQSPKAGTTAKRGTRVQLNASLGPNPGPLQTVPKVLGLTARQAITRLRNADFKVQELRQKVTSQSQNGIVVDEQPSGGGKAPSGTTVTIYVGRTG
jgi:beta-lactam-binding protein with PASTA domain